MSNNRDKSIKLIRVTTVPMSLDLLLEDQLAFLSKYYEVVAVSGGGETLDKVSAREGVRTEAVEMSRSIHLLKDIRSLYRLWKLFRREKPQIVHSITPKAGLLSMFAAKYAGVPIRIHTFTGLIFPSKKGLFRKLLRFMDKLTCKAATAVYPEGEGVKNDLERFGVTSKELKVIGHGNINGIDTSFFSQEHYDSLKRGQLRDSWEIAESEFVFLFVGRLVRDKGIVELVDAFRAIQAKQPSCTLLLVGPFEHDLDPLPSDTITAISDHQKIISTGYQENVRDFYAISDCFVFPSYREGFPNVVLQAGSMGLPCLVTNINGSNEIISDGENGLITEPKDSDGIEHLMYRIIEDVTLYDRLKQNIRSSITDRFERSDYYGLLKAEYDKLLAEL